MNYDLHIHSKYSHDGIHESKEIVKIATKKETERNRNNRPQHDKKMKKQALSSEILSPYSKTPSKSFIPVLSFSSISSTRSLISSLSKTLFL